MEPDARPPDSSGRQPLADVRFGAGANSSAFTGGLAGVLTESSERSAAARSIATSVMGPRSAVADGPAVLDRDGLRGRWQTVCARRRDDLAAVHASRRLERHRIAATLDRARTREVGAVAPPESPDTAPTAGEVMELRTRVQSLLLAIDALVPVPSLEALQLADAWDVHTELVHAHAAGPAVDIAAVEERVKLAKISFAMNSGGVADETRAEIDRRHREVVEAEADLRETRRKARSQAVVRHEAAMAAEKLALAQAGIDSYASFLFAVAGGHTPLDTDVRRTAQEELAAASAALDAARDAGQVRPDAAFQARGVALRAHADRLLGRVVVGGDPPAELRALRIDAPGRAERLRLLTDALKHHGMAVHGDAVSTARELLRSHGSQPASRSAEPGARSGEVEELERQHAQHEHTLAGLEAEIARLDELRDADVTGIAPDDLVLIMDSLLESSRAANLRGGRLPVVLDGVLDGMGADARQAALLALARAADVQSIVVTDDLQMMKSVAKAGGTIVLWSDPTKPEPEPHAELPASQRSDA